MSVHHRRGEAPSADLEEGALRERRLGVGELRTLRSARGPHGGQRGRSRWPRPCRPHGCLRRPRPRRPRACLRGPRPRGGRCPGRAPRRQTHPRLLPPNGPEGSRRGRPGEVARQPCVGDRLRRTRSSGHQLPDGRGCRSPRTRGRRPARTVESAPSDALRPIRRRPAQSRVSRGARARAES